MNRKQREKIARELIKVAKNLIARGEKIFYGKDVRIKLDENRDIIELEELPEKGKKKLRVFNLSLHPYYRSGRGEQSHLLLMVNVIGNSINQSATYDGLKKKIEQGYKKAEAEYHKVNNTSGKTYGAWEDSVHYLQIEPKDMNPFVAQGKDFTVEVSWTNFKAYDPKSDFQSMDPHYTLYEAKSAASGRKLYKMLKADPNALKSVSWDKFSRWLASNNIKYDTHFSVWR
jgi:hypothetical protein